jgi:hypothetical protein
LNSVGIVGFASVGVLGKAGWSELWKTDPMDEWEEAILAKINQVARTQFLPRLCKIQPSLPESTEKLIEPASGSRQRGDETHSAWWFANAAS